MIKHSPYRNIFVYFRGVSANQDQVDRQLEDNITKSLINLLEHSDRSLLKDFLKDIGIIISSDDVIFDIQVANSGSRPDALIRTKECDIYIESKYGASFYPGQLENHLKIIKNTNAFILYISKQKYSEEITRIYSDNNVIFINWLEITDFLIKECNRNTYPKNTTTHFLIQQFIDYMEELNMIPFNGWSDRDFEAFLSTENENKRVAEDERKRVKEKLGQFLIESKEKIEKKCDSFIGSKLHIGNLDKEQVWGAIKINDENLINQIHISVIMNAYNLSIGIQIEGKKPTQIAIEKVKKNKAKFQEILKKLANFNYIIRKRYQIRASKWDSSVVAKIVLGAEITNNDLEYIVKKMEQYKYVELRIARIYVKHEVVKKGKKFIEDCVESIVLVDEIIQFLK